MKQIVYTDKSGFIRRVLVKDEDGEDKAEYGIPAGPPDMRSIDWDGVAKSINNILAEMGIFTWEEWQAKPQGAAAATNIVKRALISIYREEYQIRRVKE